MDCEQALTLLLADMDRELRPEDREHLTAHLKACAGCRTCANAFRLQDADLRRVFAPRRRAAAAVAGRVAAQLRTPPGRARGRRSWGPLLVAAAAGFLLAVLVFRPWQKPEPGVVEQHPPIEPREAQRQEQPPAENQEVVAKRPAVGPREAQRQEQPPAEKQETVLLVVASNAVEVLSPDHKAWQPLPAGGAIALGTRVRTPRQVRCEFRMPDGSEVRVDGATELRFRGPRQLELAKGQILAQVARGESPFAVEIPRATVTALGTAFDIVCSPVESVLTVIEGTTRVQGAGSPVLVEKGYTTQIREGRAGKPTPVLNLVRSIDWADEILLLKGRDNPELAKRVEDILAQIGAAKMELLSEEDIRRLGDHCVIPLTRFLESRRSQANAEKRHQAAFLVADLAQPWSIPDLIPLLADPDGEVRYQAARGLKRLTQRTFEAEPEQWRNRSPQTRKALQEWRAWWRENAYRYPKPPS